MRARDQSSIFSIGGKFRPDYGLLLELHALTLVACSYALLYMIMGRSKVHVYIGFLVHYFTNIYCFFNSAASHEGQSQTMSVH